MNSNWVIDDQPLLFERAVERIFQRIPHSNVTLSDGCIEKIRASEKRLMEFMEKKVPIYGVTTGFGDSGFRVIRKDQSEALQKNLISYLLCGSGPLLPVAASRAILFLRLKSLARGYSGVSEGLLARMSLFLERDWIPAIPREGSLGASGDLIPLAYIAQCLQGEGELFVNGKLCSTQETLAAAGVGPYALKPKEGLALVNGTTAMAGLFLVNLNAAQYLCEVATLSTAWLCLALRGRTEAFGTLINERAKSHPGQIAVARSIRRTLDEENYRPKPLSQIVIESSQTQEMIQDKYSLRCAPQILGPIQETIDQNKFWLECEMNGTSDNPVFGADENGEAELAMGGNFYGGYLSHGMDYLKISLAHMADLLDRQLMTLFDEKSSRGLPANLADWPSMTSDERFLHHGLKGLHQSVSALTSETMARATPNGIFSRSSECHNQDKVSLGMSAAVSCQDMLDPLFTIQAMHLTCLAQALDLRKVTLQGATSQKMYNLVRSFIPYVKRDVSLGKPIQSLAQALKERAESKGHL